MLKNRVAILAILILVLAACGGSTTSETTTSDTGDDTEAAAAGSADEAADEDSESEGGDEDGTSDPWEDYQSPISEFLGVDYSDFSDEDYEAEFREQEREVQAQVATCMRELGWEYEPFVYEGGIFIEGAGEDLEYGSAEWVAKYGFGITTQAFSQSEVGPDLVGYDDEAMGDPFGEDAPENPNDAYTETLTDSELDAYYQDLWGDQPEFDETLTDEELDALWNDYVPSGCEPEAYDTVGFGLGGGEVGEFYNEFGDQLNDLHERVSADPRIVAQASILTDCLAEKGHSFVPDEDLWQQLYEIFDDDMESLWSGEGFEDPFDGLDVESMTEEEINEIVSAMNQQLLGAEELATLAELQVRELAIANDVLDCDAGFFTGEGSAEIYFEVLSEYEQEFLDTNAAAISSFAGTGSE